MALPASDNFNRSNGALGSDWTGTSGSLVINSNSVASNSSGAETAAGWNADAFANNQYSQVKITATTTGGAVGPAVRVSLSGNVNYYGYYGSSSENSSGVFKVVNGSWFDLSGAISGAGFAVNDVVRLEVEGTALRAYKNSTLVWSGTDSDISSGAAGICGYSNVSGMRLDDWTGGDLGGSGATVNATAGGATAAGIAPAVSAGSAVTASVGAASAAAPAATISGGSTISATTGAATAAGIAAAVSAGASVAASVGAADAAMLAPTISAGSSIGATVEATAGAADAAGVAPAVSGGSTIGATTGAATAAGIAAAVSAGASVAASVGSASAAMLAPAVSAESSIGATVDAVTCAADAAAPAPGVSGGCMISATAGAASAGAGVPTISAGVVVLAVVLAATARAWAPGVQSGTGTTPAARVWQVGRELRRWAVEQERRTSMERNEGRVYW